jgi:hypothetical protein
MANHRLTAYKRYLQRFMSINEGENTSDQIVTALVTQLAQCDISSKMVRSIGVATWAS